MAGLKRILSFDGAAAAALQIRLLYHCENARPGFIAKTDVFAGTSDGALMALYLAQNIKNVDGSLEVIGKAIDFSNQIAPTFQLNPLSVLKLATGWFPLRGGGHYERLLEKNYGADDTLKDLPSDVIVVAFSVDDWCPKIFSREDAGTTVVDAAMASSAAPLALPLHRVRKQVFVDGGLAATNPTLLTLRHLGQESTDVRVLSLGVRISKEARRSIINGFMPGRLTFRNLSWGWVQWLPLRPLLLGQMLFQGQIETVECECRRLLSESEYHRFRPEMDELASILELMFLPTSCIIRKLDDLASEIWAAQSGPLLAWVDDSWMR